MTIPANFNGIQYLNFLKKINDEGEMVYNSRTGKGCKTVINHDLTYELDFAEIKPGVFKFRIPLDTTRKSFWKSAVAEILGYLKGYDNAADFRALGTKTWDANANENKDWLNNPNRKGVDDIGLAYGAIAYNFPKVGGGSINLIEPIVNDLSKGIDNRAEILTFYHPGAFHLAALRPCMYAHQFSLLGKKLFVNSTQRSCDSLLGGNFNQVQVAVLLAVMGISTNNIPKTGFHKIINAHFYEDQIQLLKESKQLERTPFADPYMIIDTTLANTANKKGMELIKSIDLTNFKVVSYKHHDAIAYPFSV
jgi:thymidylate synthase